MDIAYLAKMYMSIVGSWEGNPMKSVHGVHKAPLKTGTYTSGEHLWHWRTVIVQKLFNSAR